MSRSHTRRYHREKKRQNKRRLKNGWNPPKPSADNNPMNGTLWDALRRRKHHG